jgi:hypothetical protein
MPLSWSHAVDVVVVDVVDVVVVVKTMRTTLDLTPLPNFYSNGVTA